MIKLFVAFFIFFIFVVTLVSVFQKNLIFFPDKTPLSSCHYSQDLIVNDDKGVRYYKWKAPESKGTLIHFHGNAGRACDRLYLLEVFKSYSLDIIFAEYPGYAENKNLVGQKKLLENASLLFSSLNSEKPIFLYGESLGSSISTFLASKYSVQGLILQSPFTSLKELAQKIYPFLPVKWFIRYPLEQDKWAATVNAPVLILHGVNDEIVPYEMGQKLSTIFKDSKLVSFDNKAHNDITLNNPKLFEEVSRFINRNISTSP
ncbi:MAG: alpha/beta hydrolase [Bacteriovoracaceae bacterium]